ncbi:MAG TPA: hypothetical protein VKQ72_19990, partial [Aggregatilineales bacterium]|nr:hypothetical protein [Aggregatilineales bacterium]
EEISEPADDPSISQPLSSTQAEGKGSQIEEPTGSPSPAVWEGEPGGEVNPTEAVTAEVAEPMEAPADDVEQDESAQDAPPEPPEPPIAQMSLF